MQWLTYVLIKSTGQCLTWSRWAASKWRHYLGDYIIIMIIIAMVPSLPRLTSLLVAARHEFWSALTPNYVGKWLICELTFKLCAKLRSVPAKYIYHAKNWAQSTPMRERGCASWRARSLRWPRRTRDKAHLIDCLWANMPSSPVINWRKSVARSLVTLTGHKLALN